ncbi:DeoR family transcriptional regulator [Shimia isoporae]|uniref:DeoR family transcriptional regulator n=1 Tax=Shimia isoporae TaxID=647720 RepID=A0A4R1N0B6_9RHOB|nr:DeoR/GlpR family DNA-binding transcription regulator [Shimia isoporae]TCK98925.1 DeoR family transcriptional regulator [Shimia isoporae]
MHSSFRERDILEIARTQGKVTVEALAAHFDVTVQTIRRDLTQLANAGLLERVHGGAMLPSGVRNIAYEERRRVNAEAKDAMAAQAAKSIPNGSAVFVNIGTSTEALAQALLGHDGLLVVTNNLNVARILSANERCEVLLTGGRPRAEDGGLVGPVAAQMVSGFAFDYAVLGCSALSEDAEAFDFDIDEITVSQTAVARASEVWLLADQSKYQRHAPVRIAGPEAFDRLYTDVISNELAAKCAAQNTDVVLCSTH